MATCDTLEVDLSRVDINVTLEQYPSIEVEVLQPDIVIDIGTVANQGPKGDKGDAGVAGPPGNPGVAGPPGGQGLPGNAATIAVGATVTGTPGSAATVTNSGSSSAAVFNFSIPAGVQGATGNQGATGSQGTAATVAAGTTTTGAPGSNASVTNSGSSSAAIFNFTIPRGDVGPVGPQGPSGSGTGDMLKSVYDTNANNIVDAAESVPWTGVTGKPATFPPSAHATTHLSAGSDPIAVATSVLAGLCPAVDNTTIQVVASKLSTVSLAWTAITGKPSTFPPDSTAMLKSVYDTNADNIVDQAAAVPWTGITGKPATFPPDATAELVARKGTASGYPSLDATTKVPMVQLPAPTSGNATTVQLVKGDDTRLSDARTPTAHASSHITGGTDIIAPASAATAGLLKQLSGNTTDFVDGTNTCQNLAGAVQPTIWSVRLRSFNAVGNPTFEVDQRTVGTGPGTASSFAQDRWFYSKSGTMGFNIAQQDASASPILLPGTNFAISQNFLRVSLATQQASLGASDKMQLFQSVEGIRLRELINDVHSLSLLVRSSIAGLSFGVTLEDYASTRSLVKLASIPAANTWTLISLPNLPIWAAGTTWSIKPGIQGYYLIICLAAGASFITPANNTWQNGNFFGAVGQSNFAASAVNSTFDLAFVQHEPGALCTTLIDCPFTQNYDDCQRYFTKSYSYGTPVGTVTSDGAPVITAVANGDPYGWMPFKKTLAKKPTSIVSYSPATGAINNIRDITGAADRAIGSILGYGDSGFEGFTVTTHPATVWLCQTHYTADTGW